VAAPADAPLAQLLEEVRPLARELASYSRVTTTRAVYTRMRGGREAKLAAQRDALQRA
jgi:hypothetical protein